MTNLSLREECALEMIRAGLTVYPGEITEVNGMVYVRMWHGYTLTWSGPGAVDWIAVDGRLESATEEALDGFAESMEAQRKEQDAKFAAANPDTTYLIKKGELRIVQPSCGKHK